MDNIYAHSLMNMLSAQDAHSLVNMLSAQGAHSLMNILSAQERHLDVVLQLLLMNH